MKKQAYLVFLIIFCMITGVLFLAPHPVQAAAIDNDGVIEAGETIDDDAIISGQNTRIDGTVNGMLIASGDTVTVNGVVNGDAVLLGNKIVVNEGAKITGNVISAAGNITVNGLVSGSIIGASASLDLGDVTKIGRNIYYAGFGLETAAGSTVDRSLYVAAYQAILNGKIADNLHAGLGALRLNGSIGGDAVVDVGEPGTTPNMQYTMAPESIQFPQPIESGMVIGKDAVIGGKLTYTSPVQQEIEAQPQGGIVYQTPVPEEGTTPAPTTPEAGTTKAILTWVWDFIRTLATLLLMGLLAVWLIPAVMDRTLTVVRAQPAASVGYGTLAFFGGYIGAGIAFLVVLFIGIFFSIVTLGGLSNAIFGVGFSGLSLVVAVFTLLVSYGSKLVIAYLIGELLMRAVAPNASGRKYWAMVCGVVLYTLVRSIPFLGWVIGAAATLFGLGAMWLAWRNWRGEKIIPAPAIIPEVPAAS